jgi:hypothetical protein
MGDSTGQHTAGDKIDQAKFSQVREVKSRCSEVLVPEERIAASLKSK